MAVWMLYNLRNVWRIISTQSFQLSPKQDVRGTKTEQPVIGTTNQGQIQTNVTTKQDTTKQDNVTIKGLQANVSIPKVTLSFSETFP